MLASTKNLLFIRERHRLRRHYQSCTVWRVDKATCFNLAGSSRSGWCRNQSEWLSHFSTQRKAYRKTRRVAVSNDPSSHFLYFHKAKGEAARLRVPAVDFKRQGNPVVSSPLDLQDVGGMNAIGPLESCAQSTEAEGSHLRTGCEAHGAARYRVRSPARRGRVATPLFSIFFSGDFLFRLFLDAVFLRGSLDFWENIFEHWAS